MNANFRITTKNILVIGSMAIIDQTIKFFWVTPK
jgi:hypothetical protein